MGWRGLASGGLDGLKSVILQFIRPWQIQKIIFGGLDGLALASGGLGGAWGLARSGVARGPLLSPLGFGCAWWVSGRGQPAEARRAGPGWGGLW